FTASRFSVSSKALSDPRATNCSSNSSSHHSGSRKKARSLSATSSRLPPLSLPNIFSSSSSLSIIGSCLSFVGPQWRSHDDIISLSQSPDVQPLRTECRHGPAFHVSHHNGVSCSKHMHNTGIEDRRAIAAYTPPGGSYGRNRERGLSCVDRRTRFRDPHAAGPRLCICHERLQGGRGAVWHEGQDGSGTHAKTATGRISGGSHRRL